MEGEERPQMDGPRAPLKTRQIAPSRPRPDSASERRARSARASFPPLGRGANRDDRGFDDARGGGRGGYRGTFSPREGLREFGNRVREFTSHMPVLGRMGDPRGRRGRINREWDEWDEWDNATPGDIPNVPGVADDEVNPQLAREFEAKDVLRARPALFNRNISIKLIGALALLSVIIGFCCTQGTLSFLDLATTALDARGQINAIEEQAKSGDITSTEGLTTLQGHLVSLNSDLARLQAEMPGFVANSVNGANLSRTLTMAIDLVQAGRYGVDAALLLVPKLKSAFTDIGSAAVPTATAGASPGTSGEPTPTATPTPLPPGAITMADITRAQQDLARAGVLVQEALAARQQINEQQLSAIGLGSVNSILQKMDGLAPQLPTYLGYANEIMAALPSLLGIEQPAHFLLFDVDSDELRSTGGFMGNYALITVRGGKLIGGVHLSDILTIDCPPDGKNCPAYGSYNIPAEYAWMNANVNSFLMHDSNLSPDFPTSAKLIEHYYQQETGQTVDGIIMITPAIIQDLLRATGPLTIPGYTDGPDAKVSSVTADNLQDVIHYYHIANRNLGNGGNSQQKAIDGLLASALLKKAATMSGAQQSTLIKSILAGFGSKDVQIYFNDPELESLLTHFHVDDAVPMPAGQDGLMVTDVNTGATYFSRDLQENVVDNISFDDQGNAIHDMTMTYKLPKVQHLYTDINIVSNGGVISQVNWYDGVTRILVPPGSTAIDGVNWTGQSTPDGRGMSAIQVDQCTALGVPGIPTCKVENADAPDTPGHVVWAMDIPYLEPSPDSIVVIHAQWTTPNVLKTVNGKTEYNLQLYRQAGSHINYDIKITPPTGKHIAQPLASSLKTPGGATAGTAAEFTTNLLAKDTLLTVTFS